MKRIARLESFLSSLVFLCLTGITAVPAYAATETAARVVKYSKEDIVAIHAKLRFSTLIVLCTKTRNSDFAHGDKEFWVINGAHNLCYVHPAQADIRSNLNLITASGHVYSFLLTEISNRNADTRSQALPWSLKKAPVGANTGLRGYVSAGEARRTRRTRNAPLPSRGSSPRGASPVRPEEVSRFRSSYATKLQFDYPLDSKAGRDPFMVSAIFHDDSFTYVKCGAREKPALSESQDGKPNLISSSSRTASTSHPKSSTPAT